MSDIQIRPDILEKHSAFFGTKTIEGRSVNVEI